jgi:hypothetical protein
MAEIVKEYEDLAAGVNRDMPDAKIDARLSVAMKRCKGGMHPLWLREALLRTPPAPSGSEDT